MNRFWARNSSSLSVSFSLHDHLPQLIGAQSDGKSRSCAGLAGRFDRAAVSLHNGFGNGQAESAASGRTRARFVGAIKRLKDAREVFENASKTRQKTRQSSLMTLEPRDSTPQLTLPSGQSWVRSDTIPQFHLVVSLVKTGGFPFFRFFSGGLCCLLTLKVGSNPASMMRPKRTRSRPSSVLKSLNRLRRR